MSTLSKISYKSKHVWWLKMKTLQNSWLAFSFIQIFHFLSFFFSTMYLHFLLHFPSLFYLFIFLTTYVRELPFYYYNYFFYLVLLFQQWLPIHFLFFLSFFLLLRCYYLIPNLFNFLLCFFLISIVNYLSTITYHKFNLFNPKINLNIILYFP